MYLCKIDLAIYVSNIYNYIFNNVGHVFSLEGNYRKLDLN